MKQLIKVTLAWVIFLALSWLAGYLGLKAAVDFLLLNNRVDPFWAPIQGGWFILAVYIAGSGLNKWLDYCLEQTLELFVCTTTTSAKWHP